MGLTNKQRAFIEEYLKDFNATQASLRAGYAESSARQQGSRLLSNDNIQAEISTRIEERAMSATEVLQRLAQMARGDMGDFLDIESMSFMVDLNKAKSLGLTHLIKKIKERTVITSSRDGGEETETHWIEVELYDAKSALDTLAKYHGLLVDRTDITSGGKGIQVIGVGIDTDKL